MYVYTHILTMNNIHNKHTYYDYVYHYYPSVRFPPSVPTVNKAEMFSVVQPGPPPPVMTWILYHLVV